MTSQGIPVRVQGLRRGWQCPTDSSTAVSVERAPKYVTTNGVLVSVNPKDLSKFDSREIYYNRELISLTDISLMNGGHLPSTDTVYTYVIKPEFSQWRPSRQKPISQTYVDVVLDGCLEFSSDFAREFVMTTMFWDAPIAADRGRPIRPNDRYMIGMVDERDRKEIDRILAELLPKQYVPIWNHSVMTDSRYWPQKPLKRILK